MRALARLAVVLGIGCLGTGCLRVGFTAESLDGGGSSAHDGGGSSAHDGGGGSAHDGGGSSAHDGLRPSADSARDDAREAAPDASCSPAWRCAFTLAPPAAVSELNSADYECDPVLSADCRTIYFGSYRAGGPGAGDIWTATRASSALSFGAPTNYAAFSTAGTEQRLIMTSDGLQAFTTSYRSGGRGASDIWTATRASVTAPFGALVNVGALNTSRDEYDIFLSADGLRLYFATEGSGGDEEIMVGTRPSLASSFTAAAVPVSSLNSSADESNATFSADELFVVFTSTRPGTAGTTDLWYAKRASRAEPFDTPQRLPVVNTSDGELEPFLACGDEELWFVIEKTKGTQLDWDIYRTRFIAL